MNLMLCEQVRTLYVSYMGMKPAEKQKNYKAGDVIVTYTADKRDYRQA